MKMLNMGDGKEDVECGRWKEVDEQELLLVREELVSNG